ncbi:MAG: ribbon-helix-helix protein, CopG family [Candidatus Anammoxibacter sp.]
MSGVKTAISVERKLFDKVNKLTKELNVSRSGLFSIAMKDYIKKYENKNLLAKINAAYDDSPSEEETRVGRAMRRKQRKNIEAEPW